MGCHATQYELMLFPTLPLISGMTGSFADQFGVPSIGAFGALEVRTTTAAAAVKRAQNV